MSDHVYKKIEVVGSSPNGFEDAITNALTRAEKTVRNMRWFEVTETRGYIENGKVGHWQVTLKIGFTLEGRCSGVRRGERRSKGSHPPRRVPYSIILLPAPPDTAWRHRKSE